MKLIVFGSPVLVMLALGCAGSKPSPELAKARQAYQRAEVSEANRLAPARVAAAKQALDRAESAYRDEPGSFEEKSLAYIAMRRAELAQVQAQQEMAQRLRQSAQARYRQQQEQMGQQARESLQETTTDLEAARRQLAIQGQAREEAERRLEEALQSLAQEGQVRKDEQGTIITIGGSVLFETGQSELLPLARQQVDKVATALSNLDPNQVIIVEGHTDSRGDETMNMELSRQRAEQVRQNLTERGLPEGQIRAVGRGESEPIASNDTPEGRANNRRVELIVQWAPEATPDGTPTPGGSQGMPQDGSPQGTPEGGSSPQGQPPQ